MAINGLALAVSSCSVLAILTVCVSDTTIAVITSWGIVHLQWQADIPMNAKILVYKALGSY